MTDQRTKRRVWQCPSCEKRYKIRATSKAPTACPKCDDTPAVKERQRKRRQRQPNEDALDQQDTEQEDESVGSLLNVLRILIAFAVATAVTATIVFPLTFISESTLAGINPKYGAVLMMGIWLGTAAVFCEYMGWGNLKRFFKDL